MFSFLYDFFKFNSTQHNDDNDSEDEDTLLSCELQALEFEKMTSSDDIKQVEQYDNPNFEDNSNVCFERVGIITFVGEKFALMDGDIYLEIEPTMTIKMNDRISYLCEDSNGSVKVLRYLRNLGQNWGDSDPEEKQFNILNHTLPGQVEYRKERFVYLKDSDVKFNLDDVNASFIPIKGDWLELHCQVQWSESCASNISLEQVVNVVSIQPLRKKVCCATVTEWDFEIGVCNGHIFFSKQSLQDGFTPFVGCKVIVEAVESDQGSCNWRCTRILNDDFKSTISLSNEDHDDSPTFDIEELNKLQISHPIVFEQVNYNEKASLNLSITNNSERIHFFQRWKVLSKKQDSQLLIEPFLTKFVKIYPGKKYTLKVTCRPKFLGKSREILILQFRDFQIKRCIEINVILNNENFIKDTGTYRNEKRYEDQVESMNKIRKHVAKTTIFPGVRPKKSPAFVNVRVGAFPIPDKVWNAVLGDADQVVLTNDYNKVQHRIETLLPYLFSNLNINNYIEKWHTLLYMEEVQQNIIMRSYDMPKAFLDRYQEYLSLTIPGLSERRPSLIPNDRAVVKDVWKSDALEYEGFIHAIKGDTVLMKFNPRFHEIYSGYDVSVQFHFSRTAYRRCHHAINMVLYCLGADILFPSRVPVPKSQICRETLNFIIWCNPYLNDGQKAAILSILEGESRPLPYCIYGPPGTGKTITVIETILQILKHLPESRILIATPSNSAANVVTERLIQYRQQFSGSVARIIANHLLDSDKLPDAIKPFCVTIDIARENTQKNSQHRLESGINVNCQSKFIVRCRVVIGTCVALGSLVHIGLSKGHFTHIIVDEAGQATEPEIMIPLSFMDKNNGQIILAGDPLQLGPVVISKYSQLYGLGESYLQRLLERFPYQKDYDAYKDQGFDKRVVTRLTENYRSLEEILYMPSNLFYDSQLIPKFTPTEWVTRLIDIVSKLFSTDKHGGIFFHGIKGQNTRAQDSPSWYNLQEATMVYMFISKLYKNDVSPDQIGIITPYIAQIKCLKQLFSSVGCALPKIGTVEEFQGQERPIVVISTVRSTEILIQEDVRQYLGFINSPKRINVALTRAQVAVIIFGNPHLLSMDSLWKQVIQYAIKNNNYRGCDLPASLQNEFESL